jgi:hypothetical protein
MKGFGAGCPEDHSYGEAMLRHTKNRQLRLSLVLPVLDAVREPFIDYILPAELQRFCKLSPVKC